MKSSEFSVRFTFENLTLAEQEDAYQFLQKNLSDNLKSKLDICIIDEINGEHYITKGIGKRPNGYICDCFDIDCKDCPKWQAELQPKTDCKDQAMTYITYNYE